MDLTVQQALWFLPFAAPVAIYVAWCDLKFMRIPNGSVLVMGGLFLFVGLIVLPFDQYLWRLTQMLIVFAIGFGLNAARLVGGGDAKFATVMAAFVAPGDVRLVFFVFGLMLLGAFVTHRIFRSVPPLRRLTPDWKSWDVGKLFPMGLALSGTLIFYLLAGIVTG